MDILQRPEYAFLKDFKHPIMFLTYGGSHAYGTSVEGSDVDLRGCAMNLPNELLGLSSFEVFNHKQTDTTIYSFNKLMPLLLAGNPNTIEMLGCRPETYFVLSKEGKMLLDNRSLFLSQRVFYSFAGYANSQLRQLYAYVREGEPTQSEKEELLLGSASHMIEGFHSRYPEFSPEHMKLYLDKPEMEGLDEEIFADIHVTHFPLRQFAGILNELTTTRENYDAMKKRNRKKDDRALNKHIMHLFRLYLMAFDILEKGEIVTYREADHDFLMKARSGYFLQDGALIPEFYDLLEQYEKRLQYDKEHTILPKNPDMKKVEELMVEINKAAIK